MEMILGLNTPSVQVQQQDSGAYTLLDKEGHRDVFKARRIEHSIVAFDQLAADLLRP